MADAAVIRVLFTGRDDVSGTTRKVRGEVDNLGKSAKTAQGHVGSLSSTLLKIGSAVGAIYLVAKAFHSVTAAMEEQERVTAQTAAVLKSTGGIAGVTAEHVESLAKSVQAYSKFSDEAIQASENMLLTFKNVRNVAGANNDVFDQATKAIADMGAAYNKSTGNADGLQKMTIMVGKALNDPIKGMTALQRVGVTLDSQQKALIKTLVASGDTMGAQKVILKELSDEFGGSAAAAATTFSGRMAQLKNWLNDAGESILTVFMPALTKAAEGLGKFVQGAEFQAGLVRFKAWLTTEILPALERLFAFLAAHKNDFINVFTTLVTIAGAAVTAIGRIWDALSRLTKGLADGKTAIGALLIAWVAWETGAIGAAAKVAAANIIAAETTAAAWRAALVATGWGALAVAAGLAAAYIITHWQQVKPVLMGVVAELKAMGVTVVEVGKIFAVSLLGPFAATITAMLKLLAKMVNELNGLPLIGKAIPDSLGPALDKAAKQVAGFTKSLIPDLGKVKSAWQAVGDAAGSGYAAGWTAQISRLPGAPAPTASGATGTGGSYTVGPGAPANVKEAVVLRTAVATGPGSGITYKWGGVSPQTGFDCSGYLYNAYKAAGVTIPRTADQQFHSGVNVAAADLQPGDAVFFAGADGTKANPGHVGIYIGNGQFIEYYSNGKPAQVSSLAGRSDYAGARRWLKVSKATADAAAQASGAADLAGGTGPSGMTGTATAPGGAPDPAAAAAADKAAAAAATKAAKAAEAAKTRAELVKEAKDWGVAVTDSDKEMKKAISAVQKAQKATLSELDKTFKSFAKDTATVLASGFVSTEAKNAVKKASAAYQALLKDAISPGGPGGKGITAAEEAGLKKALRTYADAVNKALIQDFINPLNKQVETARVSMKEAFAKGLISSEDMAAFTSQVNAYFAARKKALADGKLTPAEKKNLDELATAIKKSGDDATAAMKEQAAAISAAGRDWTKAIKDGIITDDELASIKQMASAIKGAIGDQANAVVTAYDAARSKFKTSFDKFIDYALKEFDKQTALLSKTITVDVTVEGTATFKFKEGDLTPTEQILADRAESARQTDLLNAKLAAAEKLRLAKESGEGLAEAQAEWDKIMYDEETEALDAQAKIERAAADALLADAKVDFEEKRTEKRNQFQTELQDIETAMANNEYGYDEGMRRIKAVFDKYEVPFSEAGSNLGNALSAAMIGAFNDLTSALRDLQTTLQTIYNIANEKTQDIEKLAIRARTAADKAHDAWTQANLDAYTPPAGSGAGMNPTDANGNPIQTSGSMNSSSTTSTATNPTVVSQETLADGSIRYTMSDGSTITQWNRMAAGGIVGARVTRAARGMILGSPSWAANIHSRIGYRGEDSVPLMASIGEMVITPAQQARLFRMANGFEGGGQSGVQEILRMLMAGRNRPSVNVTQHVAGSLVVERDIGQIAIKEIERVLKANGRV